MPASASGGVRGVLVPFGLSGVEGPFADTK